MNKPFMNSLSKRLAVLLTLASLLLSGFTLASGPTWPQCAWYATEHDARLFDNTTGQSTTLVTGISGDVQLAMNSSDCGVWLLDRGAQTLAYYSASGRRDILVPLGNVPGVSAVQSISTDPHDGSVWLQSKAGLTHLAASGQLQQSLPWADALTQVHIALDGGVWALSGKHVLHWSAAGVLQDSVDLSAQLTAVTALTVDSLRDHVWVAGGGKLLALQRQQPELASTLVVNIPADVSDLTLDPASGNLWGKTSKGAIAVATSGVISVSPALLPVQSNNGHFDFVNGDPVTQSYWAYTTGRLIRMNDGQATPQIVAENVVITSLALPVYAVQPSISATPGNGAWLNTLNPQWTIHISGRCDSLSCTLPATYAQGVRLAAKLDGVDISAHLQRSTDGASYTFTPGTPLTEGAHSLVVQAWDRFAQAAAPVTAAIAIDVTPPSLTQLLPAEGSVVGQARVHIQGTTSEPAAVVLVNKAALHANEPSPQYDTFSWNASLAPGLNTVQLSAVDRAGNVGNTALHITYAPGHGSTGTSHGTTGGGTSTSGTGGSSTNSGNSASPAVTVAPVNTTTVKPALTTVDKKSDASAALKAAAVAKYLHLPLSFEINQGQANAAVRFLTRNPQNSMFFGDHGAAITLHALPKQVASTANAGKAKAKATAKSAAATVSLELLGGNPHPTVVGAEPLATRSHYYLGNDKSHWLTNVPHYAKVVYQSVYSGIDQVFYGNQGSLEYDFVVAPNADPSQIRLLFQGSTPPSLDSKGNLILTTPVGQLLEQSPNVYQNIHGQKHPLAGHYVLNKDFSVGFTIAAYDHSQPLIIDPVIAFATYLGNAGTTANSVIVGSDGGVYVTGTTKADDLPGAATMACSPSASQAGVGYVTKLAADGQSVLYTAYFGSNTSGTTTTPITVAVDATGSAYLGGNTNARDFPESATAVQGGLGSQVAVQAQSIVGGVSWSAGFVLKLSADGSGMPFATYIGGSANSVGSGSDGGQTTLNSELLDATLYYTQVNSLAVDGSGNVYLAGDTSANDLPVTTGALLVTKPVAVANNTGFVAKLNATGSAFTYASYLGGTQIPGSLADSARSIAIDANGDAYVGGLAATSDFPTTAGAFQTTRKGASDGYVLELNPSGSALVYSTLLGGGNGGNATDYAAAEAVTALAVDANGNAYVTGYTNSRDFPVLHAYQSSFPNNLSLSYGAQPQLSFNFSSMFVSTILAGGQALGFSTYLGGTKTSYNVTGYYIDNVVYLQDVGSAIALDRQGNITVAGVVDTNTFPMLSNGTTLAFDGSQVAFVGQFNPSGQLRYSIPLSGDNSQSNALALDSAGDAYVVGATATGVLPTTNALQATTTGTGAVGFVTKVTASITTNIVLTASPSNISPFYNTITLTATVSDPTATGTVAFDDGTWNLGDGTLVNGVATFQVTGSNMGLGNHALVAIYNGDLLHSWGESAVMPYIVANAVSPNISVLPGTSVPLGQVVTINAAMADATATGTFIFYDRGTLLGSVALSNGAASFTLASPISGNHNLYVSYSGDIAHLPSNSTTVTLTVAGGPPNITIVGPVSGSSYLAPANVTIAATASSSLGTLQTLTFYDGSTLLSTYTVPTASYNVNYNLTVNNLAAGTHSLTVMATDSTNATTTSSAVSVTVIGATTFVAAVTQPAPNSTFGPTSTVPVTVTAAGPNNLIQTLELFDGSTLLGSYTVPSPVGFVTVNLPVTGLSAGSHNLAVLAVDTQGNQAQSPPVPITVLGQPSTLTVSMNFPFNQGYLVAPGQVVLQPNLYSTNGTVTQVQYFANGNDLVQCCHG